MKKTLLTICLIIFGFGALLAQTSQIKFVEYDLKNGLHVILHQDNTTPIVAVTVMYHVGSKNERTDRTGFAHFFEHLMFEGTDNIPRFEYTKYVEKAGGTLNASTSSDRTYYYEILPSNQFELGLWLESERMLHARVDSIGIKTQKNVVIEERKQSYDNRPYGSVDEEISKRAFQKHPYRWSVIGNPQHIRAAKNEDFLDFYKTFYIPNNAVLSIAGDINVDNAKQLIEKYFGDIPKGLKSVPRPDINAEPPLNKEIRDTVYDNVQLPMIIQAYRIPALGTADSYALTILSSILGRGQSSRFYKTLVDEQQKAVSITAMFRSSEHPDVGMIRATPAMNVAPDILEVEIDKIIDKVKTEGVTDSELQKIKNQLESQMISRTSTIAGIAEGLASNYTYLKNANLINTDIQNYLKVTKEDIKRVANKYIVKTNRVVLYYLPKSKKKN